MTGQATTWPTVRDLPPPPEGRTGWPWTEGDQEPLPSAAAGWPKITVITPSFNQAPFLEATLRSVLLQGYPDLEYFVLDGGSTDGSVELIRKYARWLTGWASERDGGQAAAIDRGLRRGTGLLATWINSDDMLYRDALRTFAARVPVDAHTLYIGDCLYIDERDTPGAMHRGRVHSFDDLVDIRNVWRAQPRGHIVQPEVLFPRELALSVGGLNVGNHWTMDYELWGRLLLGGARIHYTGIPFGIFRVHGSQKTGQGWTTTKSLVAVAEQLVGLARHLPPEEQATLLAGLHAYRRDYWRETGPLARIGFSEDLVLGIREVNARMRHRVGRHVKRVIGRPS